MIRSRSSRVASMKRVFVLRYCASIRGWITLCICFCTCLLYTSEHNINLNLGVTLLSQNLLSNTEAYASYGWNRNEGSLFNLGVRYFGLGVHLDLDASYGGNQLFYSLVSYDPQTGDPIYQKRPSPDKYYSIGLAATLPLYFQRGYHTRQLSVSAGWNYSNGMVANLDKIEWDRGQISNRCV